MAYLLKDFDIIRKRIHEQERGKIELTNFILPKSLMLSTIYHYERRDGYFPVMMNKLIKKVDIVMEGKRRVSAI